jgi:hypothetical protein
MIKCNYTSITIPPNSLYNNGHFVELLGMSDHDEFKGKCTTLEDGTNKYRRLLIRTIYSDKVPAMPQAITTPIYKYLGVLGELEIGING